jgi:hypothetical protein
MVGNPAAGPLLKKTNRVGPEIDLSKWWLNRQLNDLTPPAPLDGRTPESVEFQFIQLITGNQPDCIT